MTSPVRILLIGPGLSLSKVEKLFHRKKVIGRWHHFVKPWVSQSKSGEVFGRIRKMMRWIGNG